MTEKDEKQNEKDWSWHHGREQSWIPGIVLILLGTVFLLRNVFDIDIENWWAVFILFPALGNLMSAYTQYRASGQFDRKVRSHAFWGLFFVMLASAFFFGLDFGLIWPVFLILGGLALLLGGS